MHDHSHSRPWPLYFAVAAGVTYFGGLAAQHLVAASPATYISLYLLTYFFGGFFTVGEAISSLRRGRFDVDFLMLVAAVGAGAVGRWSEGAVLLFLFSLGHALEEFALAKATRSISALADLTPQVATVLRPVAPGQQESSSEDITSGQEQVQVPVEELRLGETVLVRPNSRIPADGVLLTGNASVDQAPVTGESMPVDKGEGAPLYAGTINGPTSFLMTVTASAEESVLSRVVNLVEGGEATASPTSRFVERFQLFYVPIVLAFVVGILLFGLVALHEPFNTAFYRSMLVLVAASPCALAIATPSALVTAIARAARAGVLVKGGSVLELLADVDTLVFDKTGTLTAGTPTISTTVVGPNTTEETLRAITLAVEEQSDHPLGVALARQLADLVPTNHRVQAQDVETIPGKGVVGQVGGQPVEIGNQKLIGDAPTWVSEALTTAQQEGETTLTVRLGNEYLGVFGLIDAPRKEAHTALKQLKAAGIHQTILLSGDHQEVATTIGTRVGTDQAIGGLMPEEKLEQVQTLGDSLVGVVGDGVNDAPALANAAVGIAMGQAGSAVALEAADIALMGDDLTKIPFIYRLAQATSRVVKQNLAASIGSVLLLVPASLVGLAMGPVVLIHEGSTLLIILNSLRLLRFQTATTTQE